MSDDKQHSILAPSAAKRWILCPASVAACAHLPRSSNKASALGTAKHNLADWCLKNPDRQTPDAHCGQTTEADGFTFEIDDEFVDHVNTYLRHVRELGGDATYEELVDTSDVLGVPGQSGTLDCSATHAYDGALDILDAKFGYIFVPADSPQLKIYAAAKLCKIDPKGEVFNEVNLHISQPKLRDTRLTFKISVEDLNYWIANTVQPAAAKAYALYQKRGEKGFDELLEASKNPSDEACEWCPIRTTCAARINQLNQEFPIVPAQPVNVPVTFDPALMSNDQLDAALTRVDSVVKFIADWAAGIRAEGLARAQRAAFPGWCEVEGKRGARQVPAADKPTFTMIVEADLGAEAYEKPELKSPTQLERTYKRLGRLDEWNVIQKGYVIQAPGTPSLARTCEGGTPLAKTKLEEFPLVEVS